MSKVVIVGEGGRESALQYILSSVAEVEIVKTTSDFAGIKADLFIIGGEVALVAGLADGLRAEKKLVLGPGKRGARLEGSKTWMKWLVDEAKLPTAEWRKFSELGAAQAYIQARPGPIVIKTDGLAAGKGAFVARTTEEALEDVRAKLSGDRFGEAGETVVIEAALTGPELSVMWICDGEHALMLPTARDYKRLLARDQGPNTGGMGAFSPVDDAPDEDELNPIAEKVLATFKRLRIDYRGVLYAGLMLAPEGWKILEFNVRFGDPEAQAVLPLVEPESLLACLKQAAEGQLVDRLVVRDESCVALALTSMGYPTDKMEVGFPIEGMEAAEEMPGVMVFKAGVIEQDGVLKTYGGRVLNVAARGSNREVARARAFAAAEQIEFRGKYVRPDIAAI